MRIVHVTPHLPPDQAANALLPVHLGEWACARGDVVEYIAHPPRTGSAAPVPGPVTWLPRTRRGLMQRVLRTGSVTNAWRIFRAAVPVIARADVVHVHSNGLLPEVAAALARRHRKPLVLTLYGTEIWHYRPRRPVDLFARAWRAADVVTFYSERLLERARELRLEHPHARVIYPPVAAAFTFHDRAGQQAARRALGIPPGPLLVNVKRLHPLAGQRFLIEALPAVVRSIPDVHLVICGTGDLLSPLQAAARSAGVTERVTFAGLVDNATVARYCAASDLFVLPSLLEALPTVAVEALASGTPVVSSSNPGGLELHGLFGDDVQVVPLEDSAALGDAIAEHLRASRRTLDATRAIIEQRFRAEAIDRQFQAAYADACKIQGTTNDQRPTANDKRS
jgi:glycosyltransferase involved in cell wall biosynthesis